MLKNVPAFLLFLCCFGSLDAQLLDSSFAQIGYTHVNNFTGYATSMALQADGKMVLSLNKNALASQTDVDYTCRYKTNGILDSTYGTNGLASMYAWGSGAMNNDIAIQPDGKAVFIGHSAYCVQIICGMDNLIVGRFDSTGHTDSTFGTDGRVKSNEIFGPLVMGAYGQQVVALPNGQILIAGKVLMQGSYAKIFVARLNNNGALDLSFGPNGDGLVYLGLGQYFDIADMITDAAGNIYGTGVSYNQNDTINPSDAYLFRLTSAGIPDPGFGSNGIVLVNTQKYDFGTSIGLRQDGKIVLGGYMRHVDPQFSSPIDTVFISILNSDGSHSSILPQGFRYVPVPKPSGLLYSLIVQPDDKILLAGCMDTVYRTDVFVARLNSDATGDYSFSGTGQYVIRYNLGVYSSFQTGTMVYSMKQQADGKILLAGGRNLIAQNVQQSVLVMRLFNGAPVITAVPETAPENPLAVYPNPAQNAFTAELPAATTSIQLADATGRIVYSFPVSGTGKQQFERPAGIPAGLYFLRAETSGGEKTVQRIIFTD